MSEKQSSFECTAICWAIGAFVGVVSIVMLYMLAGFDGNQAFFTGAVIGLLLGLGLSLFICRPQRAAADLASDDKPAQRYKREAEERMTARRAAAGTPTVGDQAATAGKAPSSADTAPAAASAIPAAAMSQPAPAAESPVKPSKPLAGQAELASRKGDWKYEGGDKGAEVKKEKAIPAGETAAPAVTPKPSSADVEERKPATLYTSPPAEGADDLKLISGVGPKLEQTLNELGIYRFEQVAAWGPSDIAWVDSRLRFKGRIERDDWMSQAKTLAAGGETEFLARKKK
ncbi:hypothetical protein AB2B41_06050 [Marimonas sp. MJW-29]|uniref:NADH-quinone oxidoreductase subunit E n=1 Tax=Sulfitobacter sediminis TaxID=3234186 RepID=A0ABV3RJK8_9RHOB